MNPYMNKANWKFLGSRDKRRTSVRAAVSGSLALLVTLAAAFEAMATLTVISG